MENELYKEPPDSVLDAVVKLVSTENKAKHSGRQVKLTYMLAESTAYEATEE